MNKMRSRKYRNTMLQKMILTFHNLARSRMNGVQIFYENDRKYKLIKASDSYKISNVSAFYRIFMLFIYQSKHEPDTIKEENVFAKRIDNPKTNAHVDNLG